LIESGIRKENISYEFAFSEKKSHAIELAENAATLCYGTIIAVGGDGTLNEVANGILKSNNASDVILGMIPVGSGNDWCRMYGIPADHEKAIIILKSRKIFIQDVGIVKCRNGSDKIERYFVNIAGLGFDAKVVQKTNLQKDKGKRGKLLYLMNLFTSLFSYKAIEADILIDEKHIKTKFVRL